MEEAKEEEVLLLVLLVVVRMVIKTMQVELVVLVLSMSRYSHTVQPRRQHYVHSLSPGFLPVV